MPDRRPRLLYEILYICIRFLVQIQFSFIHFFEMRCLSGRGIMASGVALGLLIAVPLMRGRCATQNRLGSSSKSFTSTANTKNVVILGGSFAGVNVAHSLLKGCRDVKVTLVNPRDEFYFCIAGPRIVANPKAFHRDQYLFPLKTGFEKYGTKFEFVESASKSLDPRNKIVSLTNGQSLSYDYLVIATGSTTSCRTFKASQDVAGSIRDLQQKIASAGSILIGGGGPLGTELAGEIAYSYPGKNIMLATHGPRLLGQLRQPASDAAEKQLKNMNVEVITNAKVTGYENGLANLESGTALEADLYIPSIGVRPNTDFVPKSFLSEDGWLKVDKHMKVADGIYAAGDVTNYKQKLFIRAVQEASVVSSNVKSELSGKAPSKSYHEGRWITLVPTGPETGTGQMSWFVPFGFMVRKIKGADFFVKWAHGIVYQ